VAVFAFIARDSAGKRVSGRLDSVTEAAAIAEIEARGLVPVRLDPAKEPRRGPARVPVRTVARAYQQMGDLLRAGVPLLKALRLLGRGKSSPALAAAMNDVADRVAEGERLADALERHPRIFPTIQVAMVRAGERGGFLEDVFGRLGTFLERQADVRAKVVGNLIYPVVLLVVGVGIVVAALVFFVPKFKDFFAKMTLPLSTRLLMFLSEVLVGWWPLVLLGLGVAAGFAIWAARREEWRRGASDLVRKVPKLGPVLVSIAVARFTRTLGTLLDNGIPILQALQIARDAAGLPALSEAIDRAAEAVRAGEPLARPLGESGLIEEDVIEMIAVGESANNLGKVLLGVADTLEARTERALGVLIRLMEPALLLFLAGLVLFIFMALIVPMMQLSSSL
jgi:general secretion pathway protein F/type IV pilus assembly protein PilC